MNEITPALDAPRAAAVPPGIDITLAQRGKRYGEFKDQARIADALVTTMIGTDQYDPGSTLPVTGWLRMAPDQREALRVIANKIGRILNGDPDYSDSWHDIAGYATLVDKRLKAEGK